jgi:hypothetical protein
MRLATQREDEYDVTDISSVSTNLQTFSFHSADGASVRQKMVSQNSPINPVHWFSWTWFVG